jgi:hypothetical protein
MEYATLGNTGHLVSKLCFGTMTFGDGSRPNYCPPGSGCATRVALGQEHFPSLPRVVTTHSLRNSLFIAALGDAATNFASLARASLSQG